MKFTFIRYESKPSPYMTGVMTGGGMAGAVKAIADKGSGNSRAAISRYIAAESEAHLSRSASDFETVSEVGKIISTKWGPRVTARYGVRGPNAYVVEFGGIYTPATHALRDISGVGKE